MPIYTYRCTECGTETEELRSMAKMDEVRDCKVEGCEGKKERAIAGAPSRFRRGTGWLSRMDGSMPGRL